MRRLQAIGGLFSLLAAGAPAMAQQVPDLKGTWLPAPGGAHLIEGTSLHHEDESAPVSGADSGLHRNASRFAFHVDGQEGRTFWGSHSTGKVSERLIGVMSKDGKRFVMVDDDGTFNGTVEDADTLDYCYAHVSPTSKAVACGELVRQK